MFLMVKCNYNHISLIYSYTLQLIHFLSCSAISTAERHKKQKYSWACQDCRATFIPICVSVDGMLGCEATDFFKWIGDMLSAKWEIDYGVVMRWVCARLLFAILRATLLCVRGSRTIWCALGLVDGASIAID